MSFPLVLNVLNLRLFDFSSANWTSLNVWKFVFNHASKVVFFRLSRHEPISVKTHQMESMIAGVNADKVNTFGKFLIIIKVVVTLFTRLLLQRELLEANSASSSTSIVVFGNDLTHIFVVLVEETITVLGLPLLLHVHLQCIIDLSFDFIGLLVVNALNRKFNLRRVKWIELVECQIANKFDSNLVIVTTSLK